MGFRFQKRLKILPGIRLNISKSGYSWTIGTRGASITAKDGKFTGNIGIPGTGISYREQLGTNIENIDEPSSLDNETHQLNISGYLIIFFVLIVGILIGKSIS